MLLTPSQLHEVRDIIERYHQAVIVNILGADAVPSALLKDLEAKGLVAPGAGVSLRDAYLYGLTVAASRDPAVANMTADQFRRWVAEHPIPLSPIQQQAVAMAQARAATYVRGLGNRVDAATGNVLIEADAGLRAQLKGMIRDQVAEGVSRRESLTRIKSRLGWASRDWARDWQRIAITEAQNAMQQGAADHYTEKFGGEVRVAKRPMPDACERCKKLFLGPDGQPRIFRLTDLEANGTNVGKKAGDWLPVVGTVHPHCQCQIVRVPAGWGFDENGDLVPNGPYGVKYETEADLEMALRQEADLHKALPGDMLEVQGIPVVVEQWPGESRHWHTSEGDEGNTLMRCAYGYIPVTHGADNEELDAFVGCDPRSTQVWIIGQQNPGTGIWDEQKVMIGFSNRRQAEDMYRVHYLDGGDRMVEVTGMDVDQFRRWAASRTPDEDRSPSLIIPLTKALIHPAEDSPAGRRNPANAGGSGANYAIQTPPHTAPTAVTLRSEEVVRKTKRPHLKRDPRTYNFTEPAERVVHPLPEGQSWPHAEEESEDVRRRRKHLNRRAEQMRAAANDSKLQPRLVLAKAGPGGEERPGHKYISRKWAQDHWLYTYAQSLGGTAAPHEDGKHLMVTVGVEHAHELARLARKYKTANPPHVAGGNVHLQMTPAEAHWARRTPPPGFARTTHVVPPGFTAADVRTLDLPRQPTGAWVRQVQRGAEIQIQTDKNVVTGKVLGRTFKGSLSVDINGHRRIVASRDARATSVDQRFSRALERLPEGAVLHATDRQRKLVDHVMGLTVYGGKPASNWVKEFRARGHETYLVGGIVRDLIAETHAGKSDYEVREVMKDVDLVTTAAPPEARTVTTKVAGRKPTGGWARVGIHSGTGDGGLGIDIASMCSGGMFDRPYPERDTGWKTCPPTNFDTDLEEDCERRDFAANCLYYDTHNHVIIDPTGHGVTDAQTRTLRLVSDEQGSLYKNTSLPFRYFKFRMRGWQGAPETRAQMRKLAEHAFSVPWDVVNEIHKITKKGGTAHGALAKLRQTMQEDGMADLFDKHVQPWTKFIVQWHSHVLSAKTAYAAVQKEVKARGQATV